MATGGEVLWAAVIQVPASMPVPNAWLEQSPEVAEFVRG
jgi:hypothetical protein